MIKTTRRNVLKASALAAGAAAIGNSLPTLKALALDTYPNDTQEGGRWVSTSCQGCTTWCSAQIYVLNGRGIRVRGNPNAKTGVGNLCPRGQLVLQQVYDPDRVKTPMKRTNPRKGRNEDPRFVPISWDEAADMIADQLIELRQNKESHKLWVMRGRYSHMHHLLYDHFPKIIGSPNNISHSSICAEAEKVGAYFTERNWGYRDYDLLNTRYLLAWGCDPVSSNRLVPFSIHALGRIQEKGKIACVDPRLSTTGAKADDWLPVIPGEDGALALAMAHVILTEGLWYKPFVGDFTDGENHFVAGRPVDENTFEEKETYGLVKWWNLEVKDRTPEWAEQVCGVAREQIYKVARDMAEAAPRVCVWNGPTMWPNGSYASLAIQALSGLVGAPDSFGGHTGGSPGGPKHGPNSMADFQDDLAKEGTKHEKIDQRGRLEWPNLARGRSGSGVNTNRVADAVLAEDPYDIKVALIYFANLNFSCTGTDRWDRAMAKIPFSAHITTHYGEMSHFSDLVLPVAQHMMERWAYTSQKTRMYTHISIQQPVHERIFDVKNDETEITWMIAEKLADKGFPNLLNYYKTYKDPETGAAPTSGEEFAIFALKSYTKNIWDPTGEKQGDTLNGWQDFVEKGVWNSIKYPYKQRWGGKFGGETGKFEFYSETLKAGLQGHADRHGVSVDRVMEACRYSARGEKAFIPHYDQPRREGDPRQFPLMLIDAKSRFNREGRSQNCSWYYEFKGLDPGDLDQEDVIKINPVDAQRLNLRDGSQVRVTSASGQPITCMLKVWEGVRPGVAQKYFGQGHWAMGRHAAKEFLKTPRGGNNNTLMHADWDHLSGSTARNGGFCRVRIEMI
ncbi:molybdopterin-dependent oxidoreductase [Desulfurivibrio dismutans]|uniref:molybdopterin-dependent oxidoreductase n=1 Tax=Desulfurivibrio dismutans TaxID=1398908 RepID=UPI0023DCBCB1|nr:molybdopterin-dependent oxidoreductase [Desulfurivibrio alkaliphilus]MDF1614436.1 molybdopterin-dependent oxidoreductase [Desulfurivibrio alkaliphilus]